MQHPDPLEYEAQPAKDTAWQMFWVFLGRERRTRQEKRVQAARTARQIAEQAVAPLSRVGGGP